MIWVKDRQLFYDPEQPRGGLIKRETAAKRLAQSDAQYSDPLTVNEYLNHAMLSGVEYGDLLSSRRTSRAINWAEVYEAFRVHIPIYFKKTISGQSIAFIVSENREVSKIEYKNEESLRNALMHKSKVHIYNAMRQFYNTTELLEGHRDKMPFGPFFILMVKNWLLADERHVLNEEPVPISWDEDELAFKKMDSRLLVPGPHPTWDEFVSRLDYPDVFMAWVWGIFDPANNIRQVMWLHGKGNDGKSSVQKAISSVIGEEYCHSVKEKDETRQWFQSNVYTKVLVNFADCTNRHLISASAIKQLTGNDPTAIEAKGENAFNAKIYAKVFVTSNYLPQIDPDSRAHTSRIIKLEVASLDDSKKDAQFEKRLIEEIYPFLYNCREHYSTYISKGKSSLVLPDVLYNKIMAECASENHMHIMDFIHNHIEFGDEHMCTTAELNKVLKEFLLLEKHLSSSRVSFIDQELKAKLDSLNCRVIQGTLDGRSTTIHIGFKLKKGDKND